MRAIARARALTKNTRTANIRRPDTGTFIVAVSVLVLGFFLIYPILIVLVFSFNGARDLFVGPAEWGLANWRNAFAHPRLLRSLLNSFLIFGLVTAISFPTAVIISWTLARVRIPFSHGFEFLFWVAYMMPGLAVTVGWLLLADPRTGMLNTALERLPWIDSKPLDIYSIQGIVLVHLLGGAIAQKVMLLTPAFRNMNAALEEAGRVSGASNLRTMMKVTLPIMVPIMGLVFALQILHIFRSFEIEQILGTPRGFYVYSTMIFDLIRTNEPPRHGQAAALASITLGIIALIIPIQRWLITRRRYTVVTGSFRPGLIEMGLVKHLVLAVIILILSLAILVPSLSLVLGSFMTRAGFFNLNPTFTLSHWKLLFGEPLFYRSVFNTLVLASTTAIISPVLFSMIAYMVVRTRWHGRILVDSIIWISAGVPGMLSGLGLMMVFLGTPGLTFLYGSMWALIIVVIFQGGTTGTQLSKAVLVQIGQDLEEQSRVSGAGWLRTYFRIWIPLLMPTLILLGTLNFVIAANTTSSIVLLAAKDTLTLSLLTLDFVGLGYRESAGILSLFIMMLTVGLAVVARAFGLRLGIRHHY